MTEYRDIVGPASSNKGTDIKLYDTLSDRPTASAFGIGQCQIGSTVYVSDGVRWEEMFLVGNAEIPADWVDTTDAVSDYTVSTTNNGSVAESSAKYASSTKTIKLSCPANNPAATAYIQGDNKSISLSNDTANVPLLFSYYAEAIPAGTSLAVQPWLSNAAGLNGSNRSSATISSVESIGWNTVAIDKRATGSNAPFTPNFVQNGTAAFDFANPLVSYRTTLTGSTSASKAAYIDSISDGYRERPKVCITFDDNRASGYSVGYKEAKKRNLTTSHFIIYDLIGTAGYATLAQIQQMSSDQMCYLGLHGQYRFDGAGSGAGRDPKTEMLRNINGLKALGISDCKYVAWPEGAIASHDRSVVLDVAESLGIVGGRSIINSYQWFYNGAYEPLVIRSISLNSSTTLANAKLAVDTAIAWGCSVSFYGHIFGAAADSETWVTADYIDLLDYIALKKSQGLIDDMKFDSFCEYGKSFR